MNAHKERKILISLLKARDKKPMPVSLRFLINLAIWLGIVFGTYLYIKTFGKPTTQELIMYACFWITGIVMGIISLCDVSRKQWPAIQPHINYEAIEKRISELGT
ncbi:hypothetical protein [Pseudomonas sp. 9AZ]|uniref:hypothetical protein n=1 Tax=Pseudomonas sp. 9AZ TaxID=2653168 RepID=UPI001358B334|nr:hypothetical protein [Pseudomonas sp. 9AZ]